MRKLLIRKFVKNYEDVKNPKVREAYGKMAGVVGIVSNVILCAMKMAVGVIAGSIAIVADGVNNLADASSSLVTLIGFKLASMPEDKDHPYGHARYEYITGLIVSLIIILVGFELGRSSVGKILAPEPVDSSVAVIVVLLIAIGIKIWQAIFNIKTGKDIDSITLIATGTDSRNDVISTAVVLASVLVSRFSGLAIDGYAGAAVALFIMYSGFALAKETASPLLGEAPTEEMVQEIAELVTGFEGVLGIHDLCVHNYGPGKVFASVHIEVDAAGDIMESHDLIDNIESAARRELGLNLVGHMDPIETGNPELDRLKAAVLAYTAGIDGLQSIHDFRMVPGPTHTNVIFDAVLTPACPLDQDAVRDGVEAELRKIDPKYCVVINYDQAYVQSVFYGFSSSQLHEEMEKELGYSIPKVNNGRYIYG